MGKLDEYHVLGVRLLSFNDSPPLFDQIFLDGA
jgi:hypothetical protein